MQYRKLGKTNLNISEISLGTWQVGGKWGDDFSHENADMILNYAVDRGVNFIDTADVYDDGNSEKAVGRLVRSRREDIFVATKCGRKLDPHTHNSYTPKALRQFIEDSLSNMSIDCIDLIQLHCPPIEVYYRPEIFELFDKLKEEGKIANLGVSVEKVEEGLKANEYENVASVQIIFNMFRQRPAQLFLNEAKKKDVGVIARVPLASGLLTGKFHKHTMFEEGDHRHFNREGEAFDKGETFSGIDFEKGIEAVDELKKTFKGRDLSTVALQWILMFDQVSCVIPGASRVEQLQLNCLASGQPALTEDELTAVSEIYTRHIKKDVHHLW